MTIQPTDSQATESQGTESQAITGTENIEGNSDPQDLTGSTTPSAVLESADAQPSAPTEPPPSYVKLAMRNMVRKRGTSLYHFALTTAGLLAVLVGLAYITR